MVEQAAAPTQQAGHTVLYIDTSGALHGVDEAGTDTDYSTGGGGGGSGLTTVQTSDGTEAVAAVLGDASSGIFIVGAQGIETAASGNTVTVKADDVHSQVSAWGNDKFARESIGFAWHATDGHLDDSVANGGIAGVSTPPIRVPFDCSISGVYLASSQGAATGKVQVFHTSGMNLPTSGESLFGGTAAYIAGVSLVALPQMFDDDATYVAGVTTLSRGDTIQFMAHDLGSGVSDFIIMLEVEKI